MPMHHSLSVVHAQAYNLMPSDGGMLLGTRGGPEYSVRTSPDAILEPSDPLEGDTTTTMDV
ncbi:hypothetical protein PISMIDRAFT_20344 [Pisolithus microcarpus 441]|uniref:Uncharacterized protein n=1 Tax=Pisolithus microcarpus 441 TaxID=765257 RepID=A0A0C9YJI4_9AGAM|nr:hypothetical protein PISMIDRAFT_20344 [Pisolithus microcarpus 441]